MPCFILYYENYSSQVTNLNTKAATTATTKFNYKFVDLNKIAKVSIVDGLHYETEEHKKIAEAMFETLKKL